MIDPIVFLGRAGEFMLLDAPFVIGVHRGYCHQPDLLVIPHHLLVDVECFLVVPQQRAIGDEALQVFSAFLINTGVIHIDGWVHIHLGLVDMQEAVRVILGQRQGFFTIQNIIGMRSHTGSEFPGRSQTPEGLDQTHADFQ